MTWSQKKWASLPLERQHRRAADLLRDGQLDEYAKVATWSGWPPLDDLADRFHWHIQQAGDSLAEHDFLLRHGDLAEGEPFLPYAIYLDRLRSAHNVGSIFRTCEALRIGRIVLGGSTPEPSKSAMGTEAWTKWCRGQLADCPRPIIALEPAVGATSLYDFVFPREATFVLGNEEEGCSAESLALADHLVEIPLYGRKNSLNVANAFAILAAQLRRQSI